MQTPLQILNEFLDKQMSICPDDPNTYERGMYDQLLNIKNKVNDLMPAEELVIVNAVEWGQRKEAHHNYWTRGKEYYQKHFAVKKDSV